MNLFGNGPELRRMDRARRRKEWLFDMMIWTIIATVMTIMAWATVCVGVSMFKFCFGV